MQQCFYVEQELSTSKKHKLVGMFCFNDCGNIVCNSILNFFCILKNESSIKACKKELEKRNVSCDFFCDKMQKLPAVAQKYLPMFISFFQDELIRYEGKFIPEYIFITPKQIMNDLRKKLSKEPSELQIQVAFSFALIKIAVYFSQHPQYIQEFPLYEAYLKKHNLLTEQMPLETFLDNILSSVEAFEQML